MQMKMTYLPAEHKDLPPGSSVSADAFDPNAGVITTELDKVLYNKHLNEMGTEGWHLISVQAIHKVEYTHIQNVSVIGGFYFFWQKPANNTESLAFPMTSPSFPGVQATQLSNFHSQQVSAHSNDIQDLTTKPVIRPFTNTDSNDNAILKEIEERERVQEAASNNKLESRVSSIKKLLEEKSSKNPHASKNTIEIPPEANTQLLRDIEDIHNLQHASKTVAANNKRSLELKSDSEGKTAEPINTADTESELDADFDLDFDLDFEEVEKNKDIQAD